MFVFLFVTSNNYMPTCNILGDIAIQNIHELDLDLSRSLKVKVYGVIRKPIHDFLLVNNSKYMAICGIFYK